MSSRETTRTRQSGHAQRRPFKPVSENSESAASLSTDSGTHIHRAESGSNTLTTRDVLQLQRTVGNQATGRIVARTMPPPLPPKENTTGLPDSLKAGVEQLSGLSLDDVKVHYNSSQPAQLQALAYTQGSEIHVGTGQESHLAHEAWHVAQQKRGQVTATRHIHGAAVNDEASLETEATRMGAHAEVLALQNAPDVPHSLGAGRATLNPVIQRVSIKLNIGGKTYDADYVDPWVKLTAESGKFLFIHKKSVEKQGQINGVKGWLVPHIHSWFAGNLILYRGVNAQHVVYNQAKLGQLPAKPGATDEIPDFTSDHSTTKFIPFSTSRDIAVMASKTNPAEDAQHNLGVAAAGPDAEVGVVVRVQVGTAHSVGMLDEGEMQVLAPPIGHVIAVKGQTLQHNNRLDGGTLDGPAVIAHLQERLADPMWNSLGKGFLGTKTPDGVAQMKEKLSQGNWQAALQIAKAKLTTKENNRHPQTTQLYTSLAALANKMKV